MKPTLTKKLLTFFITAVILINPHQLRAQDSAGSGSFVDESILDLGIVLGAGAAGAILGLSTLSFVETPKDHLKNIAIGGAIGIVVGVGIVVFSQASRSQTVIVGDAATPLTPEAVESLARLDFSKQKIAENYLQSPALGFNFTF